MTVVTALEFDNLVAPGVAAGQPDGAHGGFGAGVDHPHQVHVGHDPAQCAGQFGFNLGRGAEAQAELQLGLHGLQYRRVGVAQNHRPPGQHIVDVALALAVIQVGPFGPFHKQRRAPDAAECAYRRIHAAGNILTGSFEKLLGSGHAL